MLECARRQRGRCSWNGTREGEMRPDTPACVNWFFSQLPYSLCLLLVLASPEEHSRCFQQEKLPPLPGWPTGSHPTCLGSSGLPDGRAVHGNGCLEGGGSSSRCFSLESCRSGLLGEKRQLSKHRTLRSVSEADERTSLTKIPACLPALALFSDGWPPPGCEPL